MTTAGDVSFRPARRTDVADIATVQHDDPEPELVGLAGSRRRARALGQRLTRAEGVTNSTRPHTVAERDGELVGFLAYSIGPSTAIALSPSVVGAVVRSCGIRSVSFARRLPTRRRVAIEAPADTFYIAELHVHPDRRGEGLGSQLLRWAIDESSRQGIETMSLVTSIGNPAQRLYERHGFEVTRRRVDPSYEQMTGRPGRVLMVRTAT